MTEDVSAEFNAWLEKNAHRFNLDFGEAEYAKERIWQASDGYLICYTTTRVKGGTDDGKFLVRTLRPFGKGARSDPEHWKENYRRAFSTRKKAKARAEALYEQHSS